MFSKVAVPFFIAILTYTCLKFEINLSRLWMRYESNFTLFSRWLSSCPITIYRYTSVPCQFEILSLSYSIFSYIYGFVSGYLFWFIYIFLHLFQYCPIQITTLQYFFHSKLWKSWTWLSDWTELKLWKLVGQIPLIVLFPR